MTLTTDRREHAQAAQLAGGHRHWHIWWNIDTRRYHATPGWLTTAAAIISGPDPATLLLYMKEIEAKGAPPTEARGQ